MYSNRWDRSIRFKHVMKFSDIAKIPHLFPEKGDDDGYIFYKAKDDDTEVDDDEGDVSEIIYSENKYKSLYLYWICVVSFLITFYLL